ncbi:MAG: hypothetical protein ACTHML_12100 [Ginsengibacter sp.]
MGLSIHYSGYILKKEMLDSLIEEVSDVAKTLGWTAYFFNDKNIKGVSFAPEKSEPVFLTFNSEGRMLSPFNIMCKDIYDDAQLDNDLLFTASTKTQFAGMEAHIAIIDFLKHLSKKYLKEFTLSDEGNYWETGDKKMLMKQFSRYEVAMDIFCETITDSSPALIETTESLSERLEKLLRGKSGGDENGKSSY